MADSGLQMAIAGWQRPNAGWQIPDGISEAIPGSAICHLAFAFHHLACDICH
jgi:hypothetical protein